MQTQMSARNAANQFNPLGHVAVNATIAAHRSCDASAACVPSARGTSTGRAAQSGETLDLETLRAALVAIDAAPVEDRRVPDDAQARAEHRRQAGRGQVRKIRTLNGAFSKKVAGASVARI